MKKTLLVLLVLLLLITSLGFAVEINGQAGIAINHGFLEFLARPLISNILLVIGFLALMVEIIIPGFGIWGIGSAISFFLFFASSMYVGNANWLSVILFLLGLLMLLFEVFIPGFGVVGITGLVCLMLGVGMSMNSLSDSLTTILITLIVIMVGLIFVFKYGPKSATMKKLTLTEAIGSKEDLEDDMIKENSIKVGMEGKALTNLRPYGFIEVGGERFDATSETSFIDKETRVRIVEVRGRVIIVEEA